MRGMLYVNYAVYTPRHVQFCHTNDSLYVFPTAPVMLATLCLVALLVIGCYFSAIDVLSPECSIPVIVSQEQARLELPLPQHGI